MNIFNLLSQAAEKWPEKIAVTDEFGSISYQELLRKTNDLKAKLEPQLSQAGMAMGIITKNNRYFVISLMAGVACGALVMPVYHQQKPRELEEAMEEGQLHFVLAEHKIPEGIVEEVKTWQQSDTHWHWYRTKRPLDQKTADFVPNAALMRFTSGTTGTSKGVIMSHKTILERIDAANEVLKLSEHDKVVWVLPMAFHFVVSIVLYIKYGVEMVVNDSFLADNILATIRKHKATLLYGSPMHIKLLASCQHAPEIPSLKTVISTTTAISADLCETFKEKYGLPVVQAFGIIEVGLPIINLEKSSECPDAVGYSLPAYRVEILDENHEAVENGQIGLLGIKGPGMFDAYLSPPTPREKVLQNGWFLTGDYAVKQKGGLILIKGRKKNVINVSGNKVFPSEVEAVINSYAGVRHARAYSKRHPLLGEVVAADVVLDDKSIDPETLINYCRKVLSPYKVPQFINVVERLQMTASGKIRI